MNRYMYSPQGIQDELPETCIRMERVQRQITDQFTAWGFEPIAPAIVESMEVYLNPVSGFEQEELFKFCDQQGRLLVLRPDITTAVARLAATHLRQQETLRVAYCGPAFHFIGEDHPAGLREFTQMGVELMGIPGPEADAEVIALAITALKAAGLTSFQIDVGQVDFFIGLAEEAGVAAENIERLRLAVEQKNALAIEMLLRSEKVAHPLRQRIMELPMLYGGYEVLEQARSFTSNPRCMAALDNIQQVWTILRDYGLSQYLSIDLGMVQSIGYYTGIIFRGICKDAGYALLAGGRYDRLVGEFGRDLCATGFALGVKPLLAVLERQSSFEPYRPADALVGFSAQDRAAAFGFMNELRKQGMRVRQSYQDRETLAAQADALACFWVENGQATRLGKEVEHG